MFSLKLGFMSTDEIADWAGKKASYIESHKKDWCGKHLSKYAKYQLTRGGVIIEEIIEPIFQTSGSKEVKENYENYFGHDDVLVDTARNCWRKMKPNIKKNLKDMTGISYVSAARREDYGVVKGKEGKKGSCKYVFGKIVEEEFYFFNEEEQEIKKELELKYFSNAGRIYEYQALLDSYKNGEITREEYVEGVEAATENDRNWIDFQIELERRIGFKTGFRIMLEPRAWQL